MWEKMFGAKSGKGSEAKVEAPAASRSAERVEAPATREKVETPNTTERNADVDTNRRREEQIAAIDAKREEELTELNTTRAKLGLAPTHTSVAVAALDRRRATLVGEERKSGPGQTETADALKSIEKDKEGINATPENAGSKKSDGQHELAPAHERERRTAPIPATRENVSGRSAARTPFSLPPSPTSVAVRSLNRDQSDRGTKERQSNSSEQLAEGQGRQEQTRNALQPLGDSTEGANITPEIHYYFQEILGPEETKRRMQAMQDMGPELIPKIRTLVKDGKLNELVHRFTLFDPRLTTERALAMNKAWAEQMSKLPVDKARAWGYEPGVDIAFQYGVPSRQLHFQIEFDAVENSRRAARAGWRPGVFKGAE